MTVAIVVVIIMVAWWILGAIFAVLRIFLIAALFFVAGMVVKSAMSSGKSD